MKQLFLFAVAFAISATFSFLLLLKVKYLDETERKGPSHLDRYNTELADKLFNEVRILCLVMTYSENHKFKAANVKKTWGRQCNKLVFISDQHDEELGAVALPTSKGHSFLWGKTKQAFQYVYNHYFDDADWFIKADDDRFASIFFYLSFFNVYVCLAT